MDARTWTATITEALTTEWWNERVKFYFYHYYSFDPIYFRSLTIPMCFGYFIHSIISSDENSIGRAKQKKNNNNNGNHFIQVPFLLLWNAEIMCDEAKTFQN